MSSEAETAWAAGIFEGEGTICPKRGKGNDHRYWAAVIMTDQDVLERYAAIIGLGRLYGPYQPTNPKAQPIWRWMTTKNAEIGQLHELIGPWLRSRRSSAFLNAIADINANPATTAHYLKLSSDLHARIRERYAAGGITQQQLGTDFGVTQSMVSVIVRPPKSAK